MGSPGPTIHQSSIVIQILYSPQNGGGGPSEGRAMYRYLWYRPILAYLNSLSFSQSKLTFLRWWNRVILYAAFDFLSVVSQGNNEIQYLCTKSHLFFLSSSGALEVFVILLTSIKSFIWGSWDWFLTFWLLKLWDVLWSVVQICAVAPKARFLALDVAPFKAHQEWHIPNFFLHI